MCAAGFLDVHGTVCMALYDFGAALQIASLLIGGMIRRPGCPPEVMAGVDADAFLAMVRL
jgi:hypothetical protein